MQCSSATSIRRIRPLITSVAWTVLDSSRFKYYKPSRHPIRLCVRRYTNESRQKTTKSFNCTRNFFKICPITSNNSYKKKRLTHISSPARENTADRTARSKQYIRAQFAVPVAYKTPQYDSCSRISTQLLTAPTSPNYILRLLSPPTYPDNDSRFRTYPSGVWFVTSIKREIFALLVRYAAQAGISYRRFGTTNPSHLYGPITWPLKVGQAGCPETTNIRCGMSHNSDDIIYTAYEAWNQALTF